MFLQELKLSGRKVLVKTPKSDYEPLFRSIKCWFLGSYLFGADGRTNTRCNKHKQFKDRVNISLNNKGPTAKKEKIISSHKAERQKQTKNTPRRFCLLRRGVQFCVSSVDTGIFSTPSHQFRDLKWFGHLTVIGTTLRDWEVWNRRARRERLTI